MWNQFGSHKPFEETLQKQITLGNPLVTIFLSNTVIDPGWKPNHNSCWDSDHYIYWHSCPTSVWWGSAGSHVPTHSSVVMNDPWVFCPKVLPLLMQWGTISNSLPLPPQNYGAWGNLSLAQIWPTVASFNFDSALLHLTSLHKEAPSLLYSSPVFLSLEKYTPCHKQFIFY